MPPKRRKKRAAPVTCHEGEEFLELAVKCKFITAQKRQEMLPGIQAKSKKNPKAPLAQFLLGKEILSKEKIQLLFSIKKHIEILKADRQFGEMGVANQFVRPDRVKKALDLQVDIFRKTKKSIKIGDILLQSRNISPADNTALLLTQDRIPDELLSEALYAIAKTEAEEMEINRRFGAIAIKKELITAGQLNKALKYQKKEFTGKKQKSCLGDVLKELYQLSDADITSILKIQKTLETERMNLEEKLIEYNAQKKAERQRMELDPFFEYHVTENKLEAFVRKTKKPAKKIELSDFIGWLSLNGIKFGRADSKDIQAFLDRDDFQENFKIAQGIPPHPFKDETVDFKFDTRFFDNDGSGENGSKLLEVEANDVLAIVTTPHEEGKLGTDVFSHPVQLTGTPVKPLTCGEGVKREGDQFIALISGHPGLDKNRNLCVTPRAEAAPREDAVPPTASTPREVPGPRTKAAPQTVPDAQKEPEYQAEAALQAENGLSTKEIDGDITSDTNDEYISCNLKVNGNIAPGILVTCHDLFVEGEILGNVSVSGNIEAKGNIGSMPVSSKEKDSAVQVTSKGQIHVYGNIVNAKIFTGKGLNAPKGDLVSSVIASCDDVVVNNIRSTSQAPSKIKITREDVLVKAEMAKMEAAIKETSEELDGLLGSDELKESTKDLMKKDQALQKYQEKQDVILYLNTVFADADFEEICNVDQKIEAFEEKRKKAGETNTGPALPRTITSEKYINLILGKIRDLKLEEQLSYIREFQDCASGMYNAVKKAKEKLDKKYESLSKGVEKESPKIDQAKQKIYELRKEMDLLLAEQEKANTNLEPLIKVKNQVEPFTIIMGEKAKLVIDKAVYRVKFKEEAAAPGKKAKIIEEGYFE